VFGDLLRYWSRAQHEQPDRVGHSVSPATVMLKRGELSQRERTKLVPLGRLIGGDVEQDLEFLLTPNELGHMIVLGKTGSGKTTWALTLAFALALRGYSIVAVSPHPDLDEGILAIARTLGIRVIHFPLGGRSEYVTPFSLFEVAGVRPDEIAHLSTSLMEASFGAGGPAGTIRAALGPLFTLFANFPDELTILEADRLIQDPAFALSFVRRLPDPLPAVRSFFEGLAGRSRNQLMHGSRFALSRMHALASYRGVLLTLCGGAKGTPKIDLREELRREPCIVLFSTPTASLGDSAGLLGGLFLEHLRLILMQRRVPCHEPPVVVFVDELGSLVTGTERLGAFLAQSRKFRASLVGLTQSTAQLDTKLLDAFFTNASTIVLGRLGQQDARRLNDLPRPGGKDATKFKHTGLWLDGIDARWGEPEKHDEHNAALLARALTDCPPRQFHVYTSLDGVPSMSRIQAFPFEDLLGDTDRELRLVGARSADEVEREVRARMRAVPVATPRHDPPSGSRSTQTPRRPTNPPDTSPPTQGPRGPVSRF
jgi:hypothetical protein